MRSQLNSRIFPTPTGRSVQVCLARPHQFMIDNQQQLLPDWDTPVTYIIILLQQSRFSLKELSSDVAQEKDNLRTKFIRFGCDLIFSLKDHNYPSDLFDPRTGYPLLTRQGKITLDDNAVVETALGYPLTSYHNCSLLTHPIWENAVYPSTVVTSAPLEILTPIIDRVVGLQGWKKCSNNL
jgi:Methylmalonic aciduria and homocystinuria type D protein